MQFVLRVGLAAFASAFLVCAPLCVRGDALSVWRATLANGLAVVVVRDPLAPVVTTMLNYKTGGDEEPIDGLAHATEHMMFRGAKTVTESQLSDISEILGGDSDADTQNEVTQYFFTVPSQDLDIALRLEAARMNGATMSQTAWNVERGAILNEVTRDNSVAGYRAFERMQTAVLAGTPYAHNVLGTVDGFEHQVNAPQIQAFYRAWYHPNNAVLVITGDVDGPATMAKVKEYFGAIPRVKLPARPAVSLHPVKPALYREDSDQPVTLVLFGYRFPGFDDPDYAAGQVLLAALNNDRSDLSALVVDGKSLETGFESQDYPKAAVGIGINVVPLTTKPEVAARQFREVLESYKKRGIPPDLVEAAKLKAIADAQAEADSVEGLANEWSQAVAVEEKRSPDDDLAEYERVTTDDVDRVLRKYVDERHSVVAYAVPKNLGKINMNAPGSKAPESNKLDLTHHDPLPAWALGLLKSVTVPSQTLAFSDEALANGLRLIVVPEHTSHMIVLRGEIGSNWQVQTPAGLDGVHTITAALLEFGTTTYDRLAFESELDKIAADTTAGTQFSLRVLANNFERGVQLLADEQLHPAFPQRNFDTIKSQVADEVKGEQASPDHLAAVALANALYPTGDPARRFATLQTVGSVTLDAVKAYFASVYRPDMTTIVIIGDTTPDAARALVEKYFGAWAASGPKPAIDPSPVPANRVQEIAVPATGRVQASVKLAETLTMTRTDPDWPALRLADTILGSGENSLLYNDLRDVHGYVYSVGSVLDAERTRSQFTLDFASDFSKVGPAQALAMSNIRAMQTDLLPENELVRGKAMLVSSVPIQQQSYDGVADLLLRYAALGVPLNENLLDAQRELATTPQQIRDVMKRWIRPDGFARVLLEPPGQ